jgi:hypothetical protein
MGGSNTDHNGRESTQSYAAGAAGDGSNKGDVNGDGQITLADINSIFADRGQIASGADDTRDVQPDGLITVNDARIAALRCTTPGCTM